MTPRADGRRRPSWRGSTGWIFCPVPSFRAVIHTAMSMGESVLRACICWPTGMTRNPPSWRSELRRFGARVRGGRGALLSCYPSTTRSPGNMCRNRRVKRTHRWGDPILQMRSSPPESSPAVRKRSVVFFMRAHPTMCRRRAWTRWRRPGWCARRAVCRWWRIR